MLLILNTCGAGSFKSFNDQYFCMAQISARLLAYLLVLIMARSNIAKGHERIQTAHWLAIMAVPTLTTIAILAVMLWSSEEQLLLMTILVTGLMGIDILVLYLYDSIAILYQEKWEGRVMAEQIKAYQQQAKLYQQQQEVLEELRHDLKNHFIAWENRAQQSPDDHANKYEADLIQKLQPSPVQVSTGIAAADAILNYKLAQAEDLEAQLALHICLPNSLRVIQEADLCVVLGNLLDNALRAIAELPADSRWLRVSASYQKSVLTITVVNPYQGKLKEQYGRLLTTKQEAAQHGIGLRSVQRIADKYQGQLTASHDRQIFTAEIWLSDSNWC